ncbi:helix-turn-helix domain-containing protein [Roseomonas gilardii subsp. gilardii]|uniref:helix-turn-helix domain-containing protein n=1 Tax=Roseomonas gilardii TaxID=257708 RepID=UPI001FF8E231|nr:helix-turn-helix domain-containing protein [Roseomonas gilardii]UPG73760.1 helix-turn-helix domain-containing protein [Roseomonas gilardii subsp. gilardii]
MVRALSRGLAVLRVLEAGPPLSLDALNRATGLAKPTLLRLLRTLEEEGFAHRRLADGLWRATTPTATAEDRHRARLLAAAAPVLRALCQDVRWPSDIGLFRQGGMEIVESSRLLSPFGFEAVPQGLRVPMATSGLGRAWLAWSTAEARAAWQDQAPPPPWGASPEETARGIRETLEDGYGHRTSSHIRRGNPRRAGDMGIAVPIGTGPALLGCINIVWHSTAMDRPRFVRQHLPRLRDAAAELAALAAPPGG